MKFIKIPVFICIMLLLNSCQKKKDEPESDISADNNINNEINIENNIEKDGSDLLTEEYRYNFISKTVSAERETRFSSSQELFFNALRHYRENDLSLALECIVSAIKTSPESVYYYHYGVFLTDIRDYANAEKAFNIAVKFSIPPDYLKEKKVLYTFDENGFPRENYLAFYNLARIYSINTDLEKSLEYLIYAIENGYPYIDNIFSDAGLSGLLESDDDIKTLITGKYRNGFENTLAGKIFEYDYGVGDLGYYFTDEENVKKYIPASDIRGHILYGTYEIKNYNVYIRYNRETGQKGVTGTELGAGAGAMLYENYNNYSGDTDENEILPITDMLSGKVWKEVNRYYDLYKK